MRIQNATFGSDIEFFVQTRKGDHIPAINMVGGTKEKPKALGKGYYIQEDNVAVEFNIPVARDCRQFADFVSIGFNKCQSMLPEAVEPSRHASMVFDEVYIEGSPKANEFGCEPDLNAWTREVNPRPHANNRFLRSCGGHIHIGFDKPTMDTRFDLIKACDVFAAIPAIWEDGDKRRRELYGKAGAMRIKPYGVEHRVLSNYWLFEEDLSYEVILRYQRAVNFVNYGHQIEEGDSGDIIKAINTSDEILGKKLLAKYLGKMKNVG